MIELTKEQFEMLEKILDKAIYELDLNAGIMSHGEVLTISAIGEEIIEIAKVREELVTLSNIRTNEAISLNDLGLSQACLQSFLDEYIKARKKFKPMINFHEAYAIIKEELDEFWDEVKGKHQNRTDRCKSELIQVAAMCLAALIELPRKKRTAVAKLCPFCESTNLVDDCNGWLCLNCLERFE